jgi:transposase
MYYIGLDVHMKTISFCVKDAAGHAHMEGKIGSTRHELDAWIMTLPQPRMIAMEATIFTGWIYDQLPPHADQVKVAHPLMLRAISAAKRKNDRIDAGKIADCLRCDFLAECHMASTEIRDRRRILRYRGLVLRQAVQMKNRVSGLLMETGVSYNKLRLHRMGYVRELMSTNEEVSESIRPLLRLCREHIDRSIRLDTTLLRSLEQDPLLADRLRRLRTIPRVGPITALTWALEVGDTSRFRSIKQAISHCGLCSAEKSSPNKMMRTPISRQRNKHIQQVLVEAARLAPRYSEELALLYERERQRGNGNRATLAVARKMVAMMLAVERRNTDFVPAGEFRRTAAAQKPSREGKSIRIHRCAGCQVAQITGRATEATPEALFGLFRDWQRTQTQSSATAQRSLRQQMDVRFCPVQEPIAERHTCAAIDPDQTDHAVSRARTEISRFSVDKDLHGCRIEGRA